MDGFYFLWISWVVQIHSCRNWLSNSLTLELFAVPAVVKFYGEMHSRVDSSLSSYTTQFDLLDKPKFMGYLHLYEHIISLAQTRVNGICASDVLDLSGACQLKV
jgi:hypothetical protein